MHLNGSVNKDFIEGKLQLLEQIFGIIEGHSAGDDEDAVTKAEAFIFITDAFADIGSEHQHLVNQDTDSAVEMMVEYFLKPLSTIMPDFLDVGLLLTVYENKNIVLALPAKEEVADFLKHNVSSGDPRVAAYSNGGIVVIRMDKPGPIDKPGR